MITFSREAITLFGFSVRWYGILIALGMWLGLVLAGKREKRYGLEADTLLSMALWVLPVAIVCARLYYVLFSWDMYKDDLMRIFRIREGGLAIYGGIIGGVGTGLIFSRIKRVSIPAAADVAAPAIALGQAIGRWGNFLNQEAYGIAITRPGWQFFPAAVFIEAENGWFAATFFYESMWCFMICALILILERKKHLPHGYMALLYVLLYAAERVLVEGLRMDSLYMGSIRVSQLLSAVVLAACAAFFALSWKKSAARRIFLGGTLIFSALMICCVLGVWALPSFVLPVADALCVILALAGLFTEKASAA